MTPGPGFVSGLVLRRRRWRGLRSFPSLELLPFTDPVLNPSDDEDSWRETMAVVVAPPETALPTADGSREKQEEE
jgi:hypothetical protein